MAELNPIRYRSYYYDIETDLYYLNSRYYNPEIGRFINADVYVSTGQGILGNNMFAYCENNPVSQQDPYGTKSFWSKLKDFGKKVVKAAVVVATVTVVAGITVAAFTGTIMSGGAGAVAIPAVVAVASVMLEACVAVAAVGVTAVGVGEIGENIHEVNGNGHKGRSTYNKNGNRVDYEVYGNGNGNVHIHIGDNKYSIFKYNNGVKSFEKLTKSLEKIVSSSDIQKAISKAIEYVISLCQ